MKNIGVFASSDEYTSEGVSLKLPNIVEITNDETLLLNSIWGRGVAGDIVLWNGYKKVFANPKFYSSEIFPSEVFTPIGVIVIPASHMPDRKFRMIAIHYLNSNSPFTGSNNPQSFFWGPQTDVPNLPREATQIPVIGIHEESSTNFEFSNDIIEFSNAQMLFPFENSTLTNVLPNPLDERTCYSIRPNAVNQAAPSPYLNSGQANPLYRSTEFKGEYHRNILSSFDGYERTKTVLEYRGYIDYESFDFTTLTSSNEYAIYYPCFTLVDAYRTDGTNPGDWYIPTIGEMGYLFARFKTINDSIKLANPNINKANHANIKYQFYCYPGYTSTVVDNIWVPSLLVRYIVNETVFLSQSTNKLDGYGATAFCKF